MSIEDLRAEVAVVISTEPVGAEFYFVLEVAGAKVIKKADIEGITQSELAAGFVESLNAVVSKEEIALLDISTADDRSNAIYKYDLEAPPVQFTSMEDVMARDDFETFDFNTDDLSNLQAIIVLLGHGTDVLAIYKHHYAVTLLKQSSYNLIRNRNHNRLEKLTDEILKINTKFEFFRIGGQNYVSDIKTLERLFGFHEAIKNVATVGIGNIVASNLVENSNLLLARLNDIPFSRKIVRATRNSPVLGVIPNVDVIAFINSHPALRGKITLSDDGLKLRLTTKKSQSLFLQLLNDDLLQSELTKKYYASLAKDNMEEDVVTA